MKRKVLPEKKNSPKEDTRRNFVKEGSSADKSQVEEFRKIIQSVDGDFVKYVKDGKLMEQNRQRMESRMDVMNLVYAQRLMMMCAEPLTDGFDDGSVWEALGRFAAMRVVCPEMMETMKFAQRQTMIDSLQRKAAKDGPDSRAAKMMREYQMKRDGRLPFSPKSAAVMEVGFCVKAYEQMREDGADINKVMSEFNEARDMLRSQAKKDGIDDEEIDENMRVVVGRLIEDDPSMAAYFEETVYGGVGRDDFHKTSVLHYGPEGVTESFHYEWSGEFHDVKGQPYVGSFTPRTPITYDQYRYAYTDMAVNSLHDVKDPSKVADTLNTKASDFYRAGQAQWARSMLDDNIVANDVKELMINGSFDAIYEYDKRHEDIYMADYVVDGQQHAYADGYKEYCNRRYSNGAGSDKYDDYVFMDDVYEQQGHEKSERRMPHMPDGMDETQESQYEQ